MRAPDARPSRSPLTLAPGPCCKLNTAVTQRALGQSMARVLWGWAAFPAAWQAGQQPAGCTQHGSWARQVLALWVRDRGVGSLISRLCHPCMGGLLQTWSPAICRMMISLDVAGPMRSGDLWGCGPVPEKARPGRFSSRPAGACSTCPQLRPHHSTPHCSQDLGSAAGLVRGPTHGITVRVGELGFGGAGPSGPPPGVRLASSSTRHRRHGTQPCSGACPATRQVLYPVQGMGSLQTRRAGPWREATAPSPAPSPLARHPTSTAAGPGIPCPGQPQARLASGRLDNPNPLALAAC